MLASKNNTAAKEQDGTYVLQTIENTLKDIVRRNAYPAEHAAVEMIRFARGDCDVYVQSERSGAVLRKCFAMTKQLLKETCLSSADIDALILMVAA